MPKGEMEWIFEENWGRFGLHEFDGLCFCHCRINKWNKEHLRYCNNKWKEVLNIVKNRGYKKLYAVCNENDKTGLKFRSMFGFKKETGRSNGKILMEQEI